MLALPHARQVACMQERGSSVVAVTMVDLAATLSRLRLGCSTACTNANRTTGQLQGPVRSQILMRHGEAHPRLGTASSTVQTAWLPAAIEPSPVTICKEDASYPDSQCWDSMSRRYRLLALFSSQTDTRANAAWCSHLPTNCCRRRLGERKV